MKEKNIDNGDVMAPPTLFIDIDGTLISFPDTEEEYRKIASGD
jgi:histidinol phosphatase-like enzyme